MKKKTMAVACLLLALLSYGTSSCTSKSENASAQTNQTLVLTSSDDPLTNLKEGNSRFCSGKLIHNHQDIERIKELTSGQDPKAVVITCSDSRVPPEIIFDQGLGDIFTIRTAGNVMSDYEEGSVEYAAEHLHTNLIVVMGHESCGAVTAMIEHTDASGNKENDKEHEHDHITSIIEALENEEEAKEALQENKENRCSAMVKANVIHGVKQLRNSKPILSDLYKDKEVQIVGAIYHLDTGKVEFLDI
ncbi:carbonic anhydrase [Dysgonomonas sp. OttesenSCG-928-M03]|nr:carbonic anhydrase [Dysgonomonas sp. OttesenSCG-928-M03]